MKQTLIKSTSQWRARSRTVICMVSLVLGTVVCFACVKCGSTDIPGYYQVQTPYGLQGCFYTCPAPSCNDTYDTVVCHFYDPVQVVSVVCPTFSLAPCTDPTGHFAACYSDDGCVQ